MTVNLENIPNLVQLSKKSCEQIAELVRNSFNFLPNGNLMDIVHKLYGELDFTVHHDSMSIYVKTQKFVMRESYRKLDRFTMARLIGHFVLHYLYQKQKNPNIFDTYDVIEVDPFGSGRTIWESTWFATELLMPEIEFSQKCKEIGIVSFELADYFGVMVDAAKLRAIALGLIN